MESTRRDKFRILTIALVFSGALNIGLVTALVFSAFEGQEAVPMAAPILGSQESPMPANRQCLSGLCGLSFSELLVHLTNREPVEDGYTKRDLALSALTAAHFFNLEKALSGIPQKRSIDLTAEQTIELYPGLTDEQYEAIIRYAYREKWPLTSKGLFLMLKKWPKNGRDSSLCEAFFASPEFYALKTLFQNTEPHVLLDLSLEGPWDLLERFAQEQAKALDFSVDKRRSLLFSYLAVGSPSAAALLLASDFQFAKTRLADEGILPFLDLCQKSDLSIRFCVDLLHSPRTDAVWRAAADKLYAFAGEKAPVPFDRQAAIARFASDSPSSSQTLPPRFREHIVQEGESLWKISRQYKVKVDDLVQLNALEQDRLLPGMILRVPSN